MEMYAPNSSFETNLTLQPRNSFRDISFSSYLNKSEENMIQKLTNDNHSISPLCKKSDEDEEIGVFGAEKYFKDKIEDEDNKNDTRFLHVPDTTSKMHKQDEKIEEYHHDFGVKHKTLQTKMRTPSVRSNASWNSRSGLLPGTGHAPGKVEKGSKTRIFLAGFGCNCIDKKSTQISEKNFIQAKEISKKIDHKLVEKNTRNDYFSFPVMNSNDEDLHSSSNSKSGNLTGKIQGNNNGGRLSLGRKLTLLNDWDVDIPIEDEMYIPSSGMYNNDVDSDSSSDLFEIESFSTTGNSSFLGHRRSESNCYAPSEVSVDWSVVTASVADFSVVSEYDEVKTGGSDRKNSGRNFQVTKRPGILSRCTSHKAVRVVRDEYKVGDGGPGGPWRFSDSMAVGSKFRVVNNLTQTRGNYGSDVCPISESKGRHASQLLYLHQ